MIVLFLEGVSHIEPIKLIIEIIYLVKCYIKGDFSTQFLFRGNILIETL